MARTYSATTDQHRFTLVNQMTGAFSVGAWVRRANDTFFDSIYARMTSGSLSKMSLEIVETDFIGLEVVEGTERLSTFTALAADGWVFVAADKAAGTVTPRFHLWKASAGWQHGNGAGTTAAPKETGASGTIRIGEWQGATADNFNGDIEVVVEYNGTQLTDAQWEKAAFSRAGLQALTPTGLWELTQAVVTEKVLDLSGTGNNETTRAGTTVTVGACPYYATGPLVVAAMGTTLLPGS